MKIENRQKLLLIFAAAGVALFVADQVLITPLSKSYKARARRIEELRKKVGDGQSLLQHEQSWRARWEQMRTNALPNDPSQAEQQVLKAFDRWSQESRVSMVSVSPQWKHDTDDYMTLECRLEATGDLNSVARFLYNIEQDPMALRLQNVEISSRDAEGQQLALGMQVSALVLTPQPSRSAGTRTQR